MDKVIILLFVVGMFGIVSKTCQGISAREEGSSLYRRVEGSMHQFDTETAAAVQVSERWGGKPTLCAEANWLPWGTIEVPEDGDLLPVLKRDNQLPPTPFESISILFCIPNDPDADEGALVGLDMNLTLVAFIDDYD